MKAEKRRQLEKAGWKVGSAAEFLDLTEVESAMVGIRLALAEKLKVSREKLGLSQVAVAKRLGSSQSRVAKMEAAELDVSVDLLVRGILATGGTVRDVGAALTRV